MQMAKKCLAALAVAACALVALVFGGVYAIAAGEPGNNSLTTMAIKDSNLAKDVQNGAVVEVDVYKVAAGMHDDAYDTYNYTLEDAFAGLDIAGAQGGSVAWEDIASDAEKLAKEALKATEQFTVEKTTMTLSASVDDQGKVVADATFTGLDHGLYLVVPHGQGEENLVASGLIKKYVFSPQVIALPTKLGNNYADLGYLDPSETIKTSDSGEWSTSVTIAMKVTEEPLYGSLRIVKSIPEFQGSPVTCKFHLESTDPDYPYENTVGITITSDQPTEAIVTHIPAGTPVKVTETYPGAGYKLVKDESEDGKVIVVPSDGAINAGLVELDDYTASFTNAPENNTSTHRSTVQTGDDTNLFPFYVAMAVSGALLLLLGLYGVRQRKQEREGAAR